MNKLLPRGLRFLGRVLFSVGVILAVGMGTVLAYNAVRPVIDPDGGWLGIDLQVQAPDALDDAVSRPGSSVRTSNMIWLGVMLVLFTMGLVLTFRRLNVFVRRAVARVAGFWRTSIFRVEMVLSFVVWSACAVLLFFVLPVGAIMAGVFLVLTELCFGLGWLFYGRPRYQVRDEL